ncbi:MAG: peptidylprolyl isomerase [Gemmatimonadota bacterium]|nr:peptidylprolyl isomerase [Gemmatimonadota bacterium]MDE3172374.1 peptidylprolyl isomerase [Gemmatimonadota bacterium]MDE3215762.1 peptidylprolyl isomerase [Gemmatimonadota bacterium]
MRRIAPLLLFVASTAVLGACSRRSPLLEPTPEELQTPGPDSFRVALQTTRGPVLVVAHRDWSPYAADRFYFLVTHGYYDDAYFFRVVKGYVAQWGISGNPAVNLAWRHRDLLDEPVMRSNLRGTIAFARAGPQTRGVQLYVNYANNTKLDTLNGFGFPPFAQVIQGMDALDSLYSGYGNAPSQDSIERDGNAYLKRKFPRLDHILTARVTEAWGDTLTANMSLNRGGFGPSFRGRRGRGGDGDGDGGRR